jgi:SAM-dependent methyltransferase
MVLGLPQDLHIKEGTYDVIYCISTIEHVPPSDFMNWLNASWRLLKPGGSIAVTADYLTNQPMGYGHWEHRFCMGNHDLWSWIQETGGELLHADPKEIPGSPEFDDKIFLDPDVWNEPYPAVPADVDFHGNFTVYGFVLKKPS